MCMAPSVADADNVLKTYATAIAIVLTCVITCIGTGIAPSLGFLQGMAMVIASIFLYNLGPASKTPSEPPKAADGDGDADDAE